MEEKHKLIADYYDLQVMEREFIDEASLRKYRFSIPKKLVTGKIYSLIILVPPSVVQPAIKQFVLHKFINVKNKVYLTIEASQYEVLPLHPEDVESGEAFHLSYRIRGFLLRDLDSNEHILRLIAKD